MTRSALPLFDGFIQTPFESRLEATLTRVLAQAQLACHCGGARQRQDDGDLRSPGPGQPPGRDNRRRAIPRASSDGPQK